MPDYSNTIIYKICCKDATITDIYIGSTCNFRARKAEHKSRVNKPNIQTFSIKLYQFIRDHGGWENWDMIMVHEESVENKLQKGKLERQFIDEFKPTLNIQLPTRTYKEWKQDNKEKLAQQQKLWREENKEKIAEQKKLFYEANKEKFAEKSKLYREVNKEQIAEQKKEKFNCDCGGKYTTSNKNRHMNSKKHQDFINSPEE